MPIADLRIETIHWLTCSTIYVDLSILFAVELIVLSVIHSLQVISN